MEAVLKKVDDTQMNETESSAIYHSLETAQAILEFDTEGVVTKGNEKLFSFIGLKNNEVVGKNHQDLIDEELFSREAFQDAWGKILSGESTVCELKFSHKSKGVVWGNVLYCPIKNQSGECIKVVAFINDVTSLKEELQVRKDIMNITSIVSESDLKGNILSINQKFIELSQYRSDELIGYPHNTTRHPDMPKEVFKELWGTIGKGEIFRGVVKNMKKDGSPYYVDAVIAPIIGSNGKPKKYLGVRYDITDAEVERQNMRGVIGAIDSSFSYVEFDTNGNVLKTNKNFLDMMGYREDEILGKHHRIFVDPAISNSSELAQEWSDLLSGKSLLGTFKRVTKEGKEVWIQGVYAPVMDEKNRVVKVLKISTDMTAQKQLDAENAGKIESIGRAMATIEFSLEGKILSANENFLKTLGYSIDEIKGNHHRMFCEDSYANDVNYKEFWNKLGRGEFDSGRYKRIGKAGKIVWIQASYNPILDVNGRPYKIIKFATDISLQVEVEETVTKLANEFSKSSQEISIRATSVARGAQSLGATTEEMNASIEELTASINSIAQNSKNTDVVAKATHQEAEVGSKSIKKAIEAMELISKSSEDISEIVKVISEIAGQTNLLAFNAAIEAARAGEHGLGFSVVADEVRKLAERSSQATKEISKLINESVKRIAQGSEISKDAGVAFEKILTGVNRTTQAIAEVSCAADEQLVAAKEISSAVQQIADETEKSAIACDSIALETTELTKGSEELKLTVLKFRA